VAPAFGTANAVTISPKNGGTGLTDNNFCSFLLTFPSGAATNDTLTFRVNFVTSAEVAYFIGNGYNDTGNINVTGGVAIGGTTKYVVYYP
jgi:hypothetical protein